MSSFQWYKFDVGSTAWEQLSDLRCVYDKAGIAYTSALRQFLKDEQDIVSLLRQSLLDNKHTHAMALQNVANLKPEEVLQLLPELIYAACHSPQSETVREIILSLPRQLVLDKAEAAAESTLKNGTEYEYRRLLELYELLDPALTYRLAYRASLSDVPEIKEAGEDCLQHEELQGAEHSASEATIAGSLTTFGRIWNTPEEDAAWKYLEDV